MPYIHQQGETVSQRSEYHRFPAHAAIGARRGRLARSHNVARITKVQKQKYADKLAHNRYEMGLYGTETRAAVTVGGGKSLFCRACFDLLPFGLKTGLCSCGEENGFGTRIAEAEGLSRRGKR